MYSKDMPLILVTLHESLPRENLGYHQLVSLSVFFPSSPEVDSKTKQGLGLLHSKFCEHLRNFTFSQVFCYALTVEENGLCGDPQGTETEQRKTKPGIWNLMFN